MFSINRRRQHCIKSTFALGTSIQYLHGCSPAGSGLPLFPVSPASSGGGWGTWKFGEESPRSAARGLGGRGAVVAEREREGAGKVVGQRAAAVRLPDGKQEEQQQEEQQQQLQGERHAAHLPAEGAEPSPLLGLQNQSRRCEWAPDESGLGRRGWG